MFTILVDNSFFKMIIIFIMIFNSIMINSNEYSISFNVSGIPDQEFNLLFNNETEFIEYAQNNNLDGDGSSDNPYILMDIEFYSVKCFQLLYSDLHIIIRNCTFYEKENPYSRGIALYKTNNFTLINCQFNNFVRGISLGECNNVNIINTDFYNSSDSSIYAYFKNNNTIIDNCSFYSCNRAVKLENTNSMKIMRSSIMDTVEDSIFANDANLIHIENTSFNNAKYINNYNVNDFSLVNCDLNNTGVFGEFEFYVIQNNNFSRFQDETLFINSNFGKIVDNNFLHIDEIFMISGICWINSNYMQNCTSIGTIIGKDCNISDNKIMDCNNGFLLQTNSSKINGNIISNITNTGIHLKSLHDYGGNNKISENHINYCNVGLVIEDSIGNNIIFLNIFNNCDNYSIFVDRNSSVTTQVYRNQFIKNKNTTNSLCYDDSGINWFQNKTGNYWANHLIRYPYSIPTSEGYWNVSYVIQGSGNSEDKYPLTNIIPDTNNPVIYDYSLNVSYTGSTYWFNFSIEDDLFYSNMYIKNISITYCDRYHEIIIYPEMNSRNIYNISIIIPTNIKYFTYHIYSEDVYGNNIRTELKNISVIDDIAPIILDVQVEPDQIFSNETFTILISYTEYIEITSVNFFIENNLEFNIEIVNNTLIRIIIDLPQNISGNLNFSIEIQDQYNIVRSEKYSIFVIDNIKPMSIFIYDPDEIFNGETFSIIVSIFDNIKMDTVYIDYTFDQISFNKSMVKNIDDKYEIEITCPISSEYFFSYRLIASDISNNILISDYYEIPIYDLIPPYSEYWIPSENHCGELIELRWNYSDNIGIKKFHLPHY